MKKISLLILFVLFGYTIINASDWQIDQKGANIINCPTDETPPVKLLLGRDGLPSWRWFSAHGIQPKKDKSSGELFLTKIAGGKCFFAMKFKFSHPVTKFRYTTPLCKAVVFNNNGCDFEYSTDGGKTFNVITKFDSSTSGYIKGGMLQPQTGKWINLGAKGAQEITIKIVLSGYIRQIFFGGGESNGNIIEYEYNPDLKGIGMIIKLEPDHSKVAGVYYQGQEPVIFVTDISKKKRNIPTVEVFDIGRNTPAGNCASSMIGNTAVMSLPKLQPGIYELRFMTENEVKTIRRVVLIKPARELSWAETVESPFGIVGITRPGVFRKSAFINGPELGKMIGVHQARTSGGSSWVTVCNSGIDQYKWNNNPEKKVLDMAQYGIALRNCLAWTPRWAIDPKRVKKGHWFGHYPPQEKYFDKFAEFCRLSAERNKGIFVPEYEIWNEPNNEPYGSFKGNFSEFVKICKTAANAVHSVDPDARMILGTTGDSDVGYIYKLLKAGLSKDYAIVDIHPYRHTDQGPEDGLLSDINRLKNVIKKFSGNQDIIFSEVGWPTHIGYHQSYLPVTEFQQACFNTRTLLISIASDVKRIHFHILRDWGLSPHHPEHHFGFVKTSGESKLSIPAMSTVARHLEHAKFIGRLELPDFYHAWYWDTPWEKDCKLVTVWADTQALGKKPEWISLKGTLVDAEDIWGGMPSKSRLNISGKEIKVLPGADPIFLYVKDSGNVKLKKLPPALRPFFIKKIDVKKYNGKTDYSRLDNYFNFTTAADKSMGYAGIGGKGEKAVTSNKKSSFSVRYDNKGLYIIVNVKSGKPMKNDKSGWWIWAGDCVRLYLGFDDSAFFGDSQYQICIAPETTNHGPAQAVRISYDSNGKGAGTIIKDAVIKAQNTADGWTLQAMIPWSFFPEKPKSGDSWTFDISVPGGYWNSSSSDKWNNPLRWGQIKFK